jgi:CHAT domain-containing protein
VQTYDASVRIKTAFIAVIAPLALLSGCANAPSGVNRVLGQIPGVSVMVDANELQLISQRMENDELSEQDLKEIEARPLPAPPGMSYEVAVLRKAIAALARGNNQGVVDARGLMQRHGRNPEFQHYADTLAAQAEAQRGNLQTALKYFHNVEQKLYADARDQTKNLAPSMVDQIVSVLGSHVGMAIGAAQTDLAERLLRDYVEREGAFPSARPFMRHALVAYGTTARASLAAIRGDYQTGYALASKARALHRAWTKSAGALSEQDARAASALELSILYFLVEMSVNRGELASARVHLDEMRLAAPQGASTKRTDAMVSRAEGVFLAAAGDYHGALRAFQHVTSKQILMERNSAPGRMSTAYNTSPLLLLTGQPREALYALYAAGPIDQFQDGYDKDALLQWLTAIGALNGRFDDHLVRMERIEARYSKLPAGKAVLMHYGAKTVAYQRRGLSTNQAQDLVRAVEAGRKFSAALRQIRSSGATREAAYPPPLLQVVKESYLTAVAASFGRSGVSLADLVDALTLLQTSETDDDIAAAASRQKQIPGVSAAQLRQLQDMQQAARGAQRVVGDLSRSADAEPARMAALSAEANATSERLAKYLAELQRTAPAVAQAFGGTTPSIADIQSRLGAQDGLVSFVPVGEQTFALLVTKSGVEHRMLPLSPTEAKTLVKRVRDSVTFNDAVQVPSFDVEASKALHAKLFGWAARSLAPVKSLTVVSGGTLGSIPFSLLLEPSASGADYRSMPWLIKSMAVTHMPSIASWYAVSSNSTPVRSGSFIAWADPDFSGEASGAASTTRSVRKAVRSAEQRGLEVRPGQLPANLGTMLPPLPETKAEAQAVARALKASAQSDVVAGNKATRASVIALSESGALAQKGVVMFATHGLAPAQVPGLFQPALAMAREPGSTQPSLLQLDDVVGLRMNADWVLLSACNTASADRAGGDSMSGLARGFFFAGARSLLVTHWEVESESAAAITTKTMGRYASNTRLTRAQALQETAIELIEAKLTSQEWANPAFWAAYALVGDGRRPVGVR